MGLKTSPKAEQIPYVDITESTTLKRPIPPKNGCKKSNVLLLIYDLRKMLKFESDNVFLHSTALLWCKKWHMQF